MTPKTPFDTSLSWGHILTVLGLVGGLAANWISVTSRQAGIEATVAALQASVTSTEARVRESEIRAREQDAEMRVGIRNLDGKVTTMMMQGYRPSQLTPSPVH